MKPKELALTEWVDDSIRFNWGFFSQPWSRVEFMRLAAMVEVGAYQNQKIEREKSGNVIDVAMANRIYDLKLDIVWHGASVGVFEINQMIQFESLEEVGRCLLAAKNEVMKRAPRRAMRWKGHTPLPKNPQKFG